ncbi:TetR/AcrR family transcriptional regulator [Streptomyces sp. B3I7]|uniref:TetR/AcrR family transcriptional regulator n=1 Tax=Streptomyces sp. B3I7 TaxID=3042269 RepID=UPI0027D8E820|nr:TetR/AcrR family transcriptional regulator [Streptomyces sp. B3I7]
MASRTRGPERRREPLSRERIVAAAVELLDTVGEGGLTFRALAERLATGPGAIYWHVAGRSELLAAATDAVLTTAAVVDDPDATPHETVRALALGLFDAIDDHPWVGTQLVGTPSQSPMLPVFEQLGRQVRALGVPRGAWFSAVSALWNYILGVAGQNAANARMPQPATTDRTAYLGSVADDWAALDADRYAFTRAVAGQLREHDDRAEFLTGIDLILTGITTHRWPTG